MGLVQALGLYFPEAAHQRCQVHYVRNALSYVSTDTYRARLARITERYRKSVPRLSGWLEETADTTLSCYVIDDPHARKRLRSTNSIEHEHSEVRRRTRVVRIFPNDTSLIRLTTALAIERNEQWSERRYLSMPAPARAGEDPVRHEA
jgi:putative transposase